MGPATANLNVDFYQSEIWIIIFECQELYFDVPQPGIVTAVTIAMTNVMAIKSYITVTSGLHQHTPQKWVLVNKSVLNQPQHKNQKSDKGVWGIQKHHSIYSIIP